MTHRARKRFGQNFLNDSGIILQIVNAIHPSVEDHLVEIGPGKGAITEQLLPACKQLDAIELDRDLLPILQKRFSENNDFFLHSADALKFDFCQLQQNQKLRIVGNLPYNISTPLIFHILDKRECIQDMHFMLQKEVVDRLAASPHSKAYGKLSIMAQVQCEVESLFHIPPHAFDPAPKVQSAFVRLTPREQPLVSGDQLPAFEKLVTAAFAQRRKTLRNNVKKLVDVEQAARYIDLSLRAENLTIENFLALTRSMTKE
ncbi:MAG: 16S rRNA (adenine(1518)-N(6)/adenine(1519)-N(6))-dimethyltransferase RsmA [Gammaproteobacteria bacterium]|nr:16S rRNA (adenine(1518)-N(6)/adenine(1519)-N(6))-dimethyltransferase RsmA [Gammaproteobacteria bacterium]